MRGLSGVRLTCIVDGVPTPILQADIVQESRVIIPAIGGEILFLLRDDGWLLVEVANAHASGCRVSEERAVEWLFDHNLDYDIPNNVIDARIDPEFHKLGQPQSLVRLVFESEANRKADAWVPMDWESRFWTVGDSFADAVDFVDEASAVCRLGSKGFGPSNSRFDPSSLVRDAHRFVRHLVRKLNLSNGPRLESGPFDVFGAVDELWNLRHWLIQHTSESDAKPTITCTDDTDEAKLATSSGTPALLTDEGVGKPESRITWLAAAMLLVRDKPEWSDAEIAQSVGKHRSTLSRSPEYQVAAGLARGKKADLTPGYIKVDSSGLRDVEAVAPEASRLDDKADRGQPIAGSSYFREYCKECGEAMRVMAGEVGTNPVCDDCQS